MKQNLKMVKYYPSKHKNKVMNILIVMAVSKSTECVKFVSYPLFFYGFISKNSGTPKVRRGPSKNFRGLATKKGVESKKEFGNAGR